jgi:asparagine synthase (glutamine-hydrolysing)
MPDSSLGLSHEYGFAVVVDRAGPGGHDGVRAQQNQDVIRLTVDGICVMVRHYASTPEAVDEPMPLVSTEHVLVYEGRIDNRADVARALGDRDLETAEDGRVLSEAYRFWGERLCQFVVGEFAFVVFDRVHRCLVGGQDSLGGRRLFYATATPRNWITSNLKLFYQLCPEHRPRIDGEVLAEYFAGPMWPWSGRTLWHGVRELRRRHILVQGPGGLQEREDWRPRDGIQRVRRAEDVDERFRDLLFDAVRVRLRSRGRVLCDLSGGYDSSTLCAVASAVAHAEGRPDHVVAWSYAHHERSAEPTVQQAIAEACCVQWHMLDVSNHLPFSMILDTEVPTGGGFLQMGAVTTAVRKLAQSTGATCSLSGHGGDALLMKGQPAPVYLADLLRQGRILEWVRHVQLHLRHGSFSLWHLLWDCSTGSLDVRAARRRRPAAEWLTPKFRTQVEAASRDFTHTHDRVFSSAARERLYRGAVAFLPYSGDMLPDERLPYLHRPFVEFVLSPEWQHVVRPPEQRWLMRRALGDLMPAVLVNQGAVSPHTAALMEGLRSNWTRMSPLLTGERLAALGVLESRAFRAAIERFKVGDQGTNPQQTKTAMYLELWLATRELPAEAWQADDDLDSDRRTSRVLR